MQFYKYDFSEFVNLDVGQDGLFAAYKCLDDYRTDQDRFPYIIQQEGTYIGFVLVRYINANKRGHFSIEEFFVMKKYRRAGVGKTIAFQIFDLHKGCREVFQKDRNKPARIFWEMVIKEYTKGQFKKRTENGKQVQYFEN